jgi:hypothetical protein
VAGDVPADVRGGNAGLAAEHRDDRLVDVGGGDFPCPEGEQQVDLLAGAAVGELRLGTADGLPGVECLVEDRVDGLGERGAGLVRGHVEQAGSVAGQDLLRVADDRGAVVLPADAAHPEAGDLVAALAGEQPGQGDRRPGAVVADITAASARQRLRVVRPL